ncbi:MAG TPA: MFS transporter [Thermoanaerobaculia bacterium]|nr:MFS transporter [Thermoanaerobaculia bacterium]
MRDLTLPGGGPPSVPLTLHQKRSFWAAWAGWALDGMDSFIYALVLVPAMRELLPRSGKAATVGNLGTFGGLLFAVFLVGWGCAFLWGPIADRFGRVRTLSLTILCYSLFTFLGCVAQQVWQLGLFRFLAGLGIGGEWTLGGILVAEVWPERRRAQGAAWMHTGYYFGTFLAAVLNYFVGARYGWRAMFALGGAPALLVAFIRRGVHEPERWRQTAGRQSAGAAFAALFRREYRRRTLVNSLLLLVSMIGLWAGSVYVPGAVTQIAIREGYGAADAARLASWATMLLAAGTILGCLAVPRLAERFGRRGALAGFYLLMAISVALAFGYLFYLPQGALPRFVACLFFIGIGGASFCVFTLWLPEQYRTECRASAFAFATSSGRFIAAGATLLVGAGVARYGSIGVPVALTALPFLAGLALLPWAEETKGKPLPG